MVRSIGSNVEHLIGESDNLREEHGTHTHASLAGNADATWDSTTNTTDTLTFATAFSATPTVIVGAIRATNGRAIPINESSTGYDNQKLNYATTSMGGSVNWLAIGPK